MTTLLYRKVLRAIARHTRAAVDYSWKGGGDPADIPGIEAEYKAARRAMLATVRTAVDAAALASLATIDSTAQEGRQMKPMHAAQARSMLQRLRKELYEVLNRAPLTNDCRPKDYAAMGVESIILALSQLYDCPNKAEPRIVKLRTSPHGGKPFEHGAGEINTEHANDAFQPTTEWLRQRYPLQPSAHAVAEVRWLQPANPGLRPTLQQKFIYEFDGHYEWRDVPTVEEE